MSDFRFSRYRCPAIHPVEGARCEGYIDHDGDHKIAGYWTGGDALRWQTPVVAAGVDGKEGGE